VVWSHKRPRQGFLFSEVSPTFRHRIVVNDILSVGHP